MCSLNYSEKAADLTHISEWIYNKFGMFLKIKLRQRDALILTFSCVYCTFLMLFSFGGLYVSSLSDTSDRDDIPL